MLTCLRRCFSPRDGDIFDSIKSATSVEGLLRLDEEVIVPADVLIWPDHRSYTRQPAAEVHMIGCRPLLSLAAATFCSHGARLAQPGEFTMRAFLSGRIDLTQAEAVLDVISATDKSRLDRALLQLAGGLAHPITALRSQLIELLADLEAGLDFVDEDIEFISAGQIHSRLVLVRDEMNAILTQVSRRNLYDSSVRAVLVGRPNAGKSSLFNYLAGGCAIVSDRRGTTRDFLTAEVIDCDLTIQLIDTAGCEPVSEEPLAAEIRRIEAGAPFVAPPVGSVSPSIEAQAVTQTRLQIDAADIVLYCQPACRVLHKLESDWLRRHQEKTILILTKCDQGILDAEWPMPPIATSVELGIGLAELKNALFERRQRLVENWTSDVSETAVRASDSVIDARDSIDRALAIDPSIGQELVAMEVRTALEHLGRIVGAI
jgi:tRNA modification GTPase